MWKSIVAVSVGAGFGALLRWWLSSLLNGYFPSVPPGTIVANLLGAYVIGAAIAFFEMFSALPPEWRLLITTGFCGGLTTFSTFSAELVSLLRAEQILLALGSIGIHLGGSVFMTIAGFATVSRLRG